MLTSMPSPSTCSIESKQRSKKDAAKKLVGCQKLAAPKRPQATGVHATHSAAALTSLYAREWHLFSGSGTTLFSYMYNMQQWLCPAALYRTEASKHSMSTATFLLQPNIAFISEQNQSWFSQRERSRSMQDKISDKGIVHFSFHFYFGS